MTDTRSSHPSLQQLAAFDQGQLRPAEWGQVEQHVAECDACCRQLEAVPDDSFITILRQSAAKRAPTDTPDPHSNAIDTPLPSPVPGGAEVPAELASHPRYRVLEVLGAGGMGVVFKVEHRLMERVVALKVIHKSLTDRPDTVERFRLEVRAAARLSHPNIVTAHDADQAGDLHFLVMEFVEGESLDRVVEKRGPLPVAPACDWVRQAALGLQHAFERGMVHRDIKPANLLLTPAGQVKILDFGLARFASERRPAGPLTQSGQMVGTPDYMAPEQALDARHADIRADIYSLGCTLYHLLAGRLPFPEGTPFQKLMAHQERLPVPLTKLRADVPVELARVVERMLAKDPAQRYQTPADVARALAPFSAEARRFAVRERPPRGRWPMIAAAVALFAMVGLLGVIIYIKTKKAEITIQSDDNNLKVNIKKDGEEVEIVPAEPKAEATQPQPSAGAVPPIPAPRLINAKTEIRLSEPFAQVRTGGAGRYLIFHLKKAKKLAVFDVPKLRVVKEIDLPDEDLLYTAGLDKLMLVLRGQKMLQRWDLHTFQREKMVPLPEGLPMGIAVMGCSSRGPLLLHSNKEVQLWDIERMEPLRIEGKVLAGDPGAGFTVRASADGQAFVAWHARASPNQFPLMRLDGRKATIVVSPDAQSYYGAWAQPNADASLVFRYGAGIYSGDMKILSADAFKDSALLPTEDPRYFLAMRPQTGEKTQASICTSCDRRAVYTIADLERLPGTVLQPGWGFWEGEPLVHYLPTAKLLITLPSGNDRVVVRYFDLLEALDKSGQDYLFVASQPKTSVPTGTTYVYQLDVKSKVGGVTYKLETGPKGMTISKNGELRWVVPPRQEGIEHRVVVTVRDKAGKEVIHAFDLEVVSNPAGP